MYITSTKSDKEEDRDDPGTRQIFGERIDHFFTLGALTKQTTLSGTFINDKKVLAELFNGYFVNSLGDAGETAIKMNYAADYIEHPSIGAIKHY